MTTNNHRIGVFYLFLLPLLTLFISCSSLGHPVTQDLTSGDFSIERIDHLLDSGENLRVIPLLFPRVEESREMQNRYKRAINGLEAEWLAARADGDWRRSLIYFRSFQALGESKMIGQINESDLYLEGVEEYLDSGKTGAAAVLMQTKIDLETLDAGVRTNLAERFETAGHVSVAAMLKGGEKPPPPGMAPLIDGTVTVWVNRGIRLVGNVGVPDRGIGSGFFIDPAGYILTNYHVIESEVDPSYQGYSRLYIKLDDESADRIPAKVVGWDRNFDLALLKIEMDVPYVFSFSNDAAPRLGENIMAIGSPGGLARTLTSGTVSAYARSIQPMAGSLQIDVPINPGNSGGPLLNSTGEVIGIVFAGVQDYDGVNFAIPGPYVQNLVPSLYEGGQIELPWFGLSAWDAAGRVDITYVVPGSPAADGGLLPGDRIVSIDGVRFQTIRSIQEYLITRDPATLTSVVWERGGVEMTGFVALGARPDIPLRTALGRDARENLLTPLFGFTLERISGKGLNQNYRVESVLPGSIADEAGFSEGDSFTLRKWIHDEEYDFVAIQVVLKGRKAGFLDSAIQIAAQLDINTVF